MHHIQLAKEEEGKSVFRLHVRIQLTFSCNSLAGNISLKLAPPYRNSTAGKNLRHEIRFKSNQLPAAGSFKKSQSTNSPICLSRNLCNIRLGVYSAIQFEVEKDFYRSLWEHKGDCWGGEIHRSLVLHKILHGPLET